MATAQQVAHYAGMAAELSAGLHPTMRDALAPHLAAPCRVAAASAGRPKHTPGGPWMVIPRAHAKNTVVDIAALPDLIDAAAQAAGALQGIAASLQASRPATSEMLLSSATTLLAALMKVAGSEIEESEKPAGVA